MKKLVLFNYFQQNALDKDPTYKVCQTIVFIQFNPPSTCPTGNVVKHALQSNKVGVYVFRCTWAHQQPNKSGCVYEVAPVLFSRSGVKWLRILQFLMYFINIKCSVTALQDAAWMWVETMDCFHQLTWHLFL